MKTDFPRNMFSHCQFSPIHLNLYGSKEVSVTNEKLTNVKLMNVMIIWSSANLNGQHFKEYHKCICLKTAIHGFFSLGKLLFPYSGSKTICTDVEMMTSSRIKRP